MPGTFDQSALCLSYIDLHIVDVYLHVYTVFGILHVCLPLIACFSFVFYNSQSSFSPVQSKGEQKVTKVSLQLEAKAFIITNKNIEEQGIWTLINES